MAGHRRRPCHTRQPHAASHEPGRNRCGLRPALHTPATSPLPRKNHSGLRDDPPLHKPSPRMFRGMRVLHHLRTPGKVHRVALARKHTPRGKTGHANARLQGLYKRPRRSVGKHVRHGRQKSASNAGDACAPRASTRRHAPISTPTTGPCWASTMPSTSCRE